MKAFTALLRSLGRTPRAEDKIVRLTSYLESAPTEDAAWAIALLLAPPQRPVVERAKLARYACGVAHVPLWLFDQSVQEAGDFASALTMMLESSPRVPHEPSRLSQLMNDELPGLAGAPDSEQQSWIVGLWNSLRVEELRLFNGLLSGVFASPASRAVIEESVARHAGVSVWMIRHRLQFRDTTLCPEKAWQALTAPASPELEQATIVPFAPIVQYEIGTPLSLEQTHTNWLYDGLRAQLVVAEGQCHIWLESGPLADVRFDLIVEEAKALPTHTLIEGDIVAFVEGAPAPASALRLAASERRSLVGTAMAVFVAHDLLRDGGQDFRMAPLAERLSRLATLLGDNAKSIRAAETVSAPNMGALQKAQLQAALLGYAGLRMRHLNATYAAENAALIWPASSL